MLWGTVQPVFRYVAFVTAIGLGTLAVVLPTHLHEVDFSTMRFWIFFGAVVLGELIPIKLPRRSEYLTITVSGTFTFALLITEGIAGTAIAMVAASLLDDIIHRKVLWKTGFNVAQYTLSIAAGGYFLQLLSSDHIGPTNQFTGMHLLIVFSSGAIFFATNWVLTGIGISLATGTKISSYFRENLGLQTANDGILLALAPVVVAASRQSLLVVPLLMFPILAVYKSARVSLENVELATDLQRRADENQHLALHDTLTGLPNRALFQERVQQAIVASQRSGNKLGVMLMDLDRFKEINDALGHHHGDQMLKQVGARLQGVLRASDTIARLGGDEFAILLPDLNDAANAHEAVTKLLDSFTPSFALQELTLNIGASIGLAFYPDHGADPDTLLQRADVAMYAAKEKHTGYEIYESDQDQNTRDRLALVEQLRRAIGTDQLELYYQPKTDLRSGRVTGFEALLRWHHPEHGFMSPDVFIPLAEHTGLIHPLTTYVIEKALEQCSEWIRKGSDLSVAVNLSVRNLLDLELPETIRKSLTKWEVDASHLILEITESSILADPVRAAMVLEELSSMGITVAVDDFGTGYSSLSYLKRLPVDEIKIDKSFVMNMTKDENDAVIVRSTIDLGKNLGLRVVAEGVEDQRVLLELAALGADIAQGFFIGRPMPGSEVLEWHRNMIATVLTAATAERADFTAKERTGLTKM